MKKNTNELTKSEKYLVNDLYELILSSASDPSTMISHVNVERQMMKNYVLLAESGHEKHEAIVQYKLNDSSDVGHILNELNHSDVFIIPISFGDRRIGCMHVFGCVEIERSQQLLRMIQSIRPLIGVVLRNYQLFHSLEVLLEERTIGLDKANKELEVLIQFDQLTGLYNRHMFYELIDQYQAQGKRLAVALVDMNGLKLLNETLGFSEGDRYLKQLATVCREVLPKEGSLSRVGDDEIAFVLPNGTKEVLQTIVDQLNAKVSLLNKNVFSMFPLSISMGYYIDETGQEDQAYIFNMAEQNLNQDKLLHSQSKKSAIVRTLAKALEARDFITEGHADRMEERLDIFGERLDMDSLRRTQLRLFGKFHDIGKVGIADAILFKPGKLNDEEMLEMKKHSEIGYKIALTAADLHSIAEMILKHHERYDGAGYPTGLAGEEIPIECRILGIVDAYDAMTNNRPYRDALPVAVAIEELIKYKGTQFDPELVDFFIREVLKKENEA